MRKYSKSPTAVTAMMNPANSAVGRYRAISHSEGKAIAAVMRRVRSIRSGIGTRPGHVCRAPNHRRPARPPPPLRARPETSRVALLVHRPQLLALQLLGGESKASLALLEERERLQELALAEVGPQRFGHVHLGVGELPEEEVAEPHLAARPDEEVRVRDAARAEVVREGS